MQWRRANCGPNMAAVGSLIGPYDLLIAGQALRTGSILVTANVAEFGRVPGSRLGGLDGSGVSGLFYSAASRAWAGSAWVRILSTTSQFR